MAKRELIDRKQAVEVVTNGFDRWHMINLLASQGSIPAITEREIVEPYLNKIRAEIMQLDYDIENIDYDYNDMPQTEEVHMICREEVLRVLDKYKAESEG